MAYLGLHGRREWSRPGDPELSEASISPRGQNLPARQLLLERERGW